MYIVYMIYVFLRYIQFVSDRKQLNRSRPLRTKESKFGVLPEVQPELQPKTFGSLQEGNAQPTYS
jgi:hypothetical protein